MSSDAVIGLAGISKRGHSINLKHRNILSARLFERIALHTFRPLRNLARLCPATLSVVFAGWSKEIQQYCILARERR